MESARAENKGVLLIGIHFLTLELGARIFGMLNPGIGVYRPNNNALYDWLQTRGRLRSNKTMLDRYDLKGMIRVLKQGEIVWYAPDHDYGARNSVFVPFLMFPMRRLPQAVTCLSEARARRLFLLFPDAERMEEGTS